MDRLQHTGFTTTITPKKNIHLLQAIQADLLQVSNMVYL